MPMIPVDTAVQLIVGPLVDDTDFKSLETGVAHNATGMSVDLLKSSITGTPTKTDLTLTTGSTQDWVELGNGMYYIEITAAQNDTEGEIQLVGVATGILPFASPRYQVVPTAVYNSLVAGSDTLQADMTQIAGSAVNTSAAQLGVNVVAAGGTTWGSGAITAGAIATGAIDADALAADAGTEIGTAVWATTTRVLTANTNLNDPTAAAIADAVWDEASSGHVTAGTYGVAVTDILTDTAEIGEAGAGLTEAGGDGDHLTAINLPDQSMNITGNITGDLSGSVGSVTGNVGGNVTGSVGSLATQAKADVNAEVDTALVDIGLDHLMSVAVVGTDVTDNSVVAKLVSSSATADWDSYVNTTDSLQAVRDHIGDGTNLTEAGGDGDHLTAINLPNQTMDITGSLSGSVGSVTGAVGSVTGAVGSVTATVSADMVSISGSATAADNLEAQALTVPVVTFSGGTTTTAVLVNVGGVAASSTNDVYNGRLLVFNAGTLDRQAAEITDYDGATKTATISAVTTAVTSGHTAILV